MHDEAKAHEGRLALGASQTAAWTHLLVAPPVILGYVGAAHRTALGAAAWLVALNTVALAGLLVSARRRLFRRLPFLPFLLHVGLWCNAQIAALLWITREGPDGLFFAAYFVLLFGICAFVPAPVRWVASSAAMAPFSFAAVAMAERLPRVPTRELSLLSIVAAAATLASFAATRRYRVQLRRRLAAERTSRHLADLDRAKSEFLAEVSHDLMNPLTAVLGPIRGVLRDRTLELLPFHRERLQLALRAISRLEAMTSDVLDLARIDAGVGLLHLARVDMVELVREQVRLMETHAAEGQHALQLAAPDGPLPATVDPDKMGRVVMNLLANACKFSPPSTVVHITVRPVSGGVSIEVADHGPGVAPDEQEAIFRRYERGRAGKGVRGAGIGLAVVKEFVELHGGTARVVSAPAQGATFQVSVPDRAGVETGAVPMFVAAPPVVADPGSSTSRIPVDEPARCTAPRRRAVVVEDQDEVRALVCLELRADLEVHEAPDAEEALDQVRQFPPDVVLADLVLPGMDGAELCRRLRAERATAHVPILLFSVRDDVETQVSVLDAGADDFVTKPFDPEVLRARVRALLRRTSSLDPGP